MKKISFRPILLTAIALFLTASAASAQTFTEGLFLEENRTAFRSNPAAAGGTDFLSAGNIMNTKLANYGSSALESPAGLQPVGRKIGDISYNLFSYGFSKGDAFHSVEANLRNIYNIGISKDLFELVKSGPSDSNFDISGTGICDNLSAELAYGYTRKLSDIVSIGARVKLLAGLNSASYQMTEMDIRVNEDRMYMKGRTILEFSNKSLEIDAEDGEVIGFSDIVKNRNRLLPIGIGAAVDIGIVVTPNEHLTISSSLLDLGGILWHYGNFASSNGSFDHEYPLLEIDIKDFDIEDIIGHSQELAEELLGIVELRKGPAADVLSAVPVKANLGLKYRLPFCESLSVGFTGNFAGYTGVPYLESRFCLGAAPWDWLSVTGNAGYSTFGAVWGAGASFRVYRFRLNAGVENYFGGTVPNRKAPLKACFRVMSAGLTFDL